MIQTLIELLTKKISAFYVMQNVFVLIYEHHICSSHGYLYNDLDILEYNFKLMSFYFKYKNAYAGGTTLIVKVTQNCGISIHQRTRNVIIADARCT